MLERPATNLRLNLAQELALCQYLDTLDKVGISTRRRMLINCANSILQASHPDSTSPPTVSRQWAGRFLKRHREYTVIRQKTIDIDRKIAHDPETIQKWYTKFWNAIQQYGILPGDTYNMDETGFRTGIGRDQWIITRDLKRISYIASSTIRDLISAIEAVSADGEVLPAMLILAGIVHQEAWYRETGLEDDTLIAVSETGYNNDELAMHWLRHFDRFSALRQIGAYRLLLFDGYESHGTREFLEYCEKKKIIPFCLPPHTTHLLQPLDVVLFQPYKHYHAEAIDAAT